MNPAEFANIAALEHEFWWFRGMRSVLHAVLDPFRQEIAGQRWLEAGCGTGYMSAHLERRYGVRVTGLDLEAEGLAHARAAGRTRIVRADVRRLPLSSGAFDGLLSLDVIVHLPRGEEGMALREFARVLRSGGLLCLRVSALDVLWSRHSDFARERQRFTRSRLLSGLREAGFTPLRATYANSVLLPVALAKFRVWEPLTRQPPATGVAPVPRWLNRALEWPLSAEACWLSRGMNLPLGQSILVLARKESRSASPRPSAAGLP